MIPVTLYMTVPPSANAIWRAVNGRVIKAKRYREWMKELPLKCVAPDRLTALPVYAPATIAGDISIDVEMSRPRSNSDLDNRIKPILDKLKTYHWIEDDKQVVSLSARWADTDGCYVTITKVAA